MTLFFVGALKDMHSDGVYSSPFEMSCWLWKVVCCNTNANP